MKFLGDANLLPAVARLLNAFDQQNEVHALSDLRPQNTADSVWIREVRAKLGDEHPVILGGDGRILRNKPELLALKQEGLTFVYLAPGWTLLSWAEFAWRIIMAWPAILTNVPRHNTTHRLRSESEQPQGGESQTALGVPPALRTGQAGIACADANWGPSSRPQP